MPSCALMYFRTAAGSSSVDGVAYSAIGMLPSVVITSASTARSSGMPATAKPVAVGGCACTTALHVGPVAIHLEVHQHLGRRIAIAGELLAVEIGDHIMSGVMNPFDTLFGVVISRWSSRRTLMLPSFDAT